MKLEYAIMSYDSLWLTYMRHTYFEKVASVPQQSPMLPQAQVTTPRTKHDADYRQGVQKPRSPSQDIVDIVSSRIAFPHKDYDPIDCTSLKKTYDFGRLVQQGWSTGLDA